MAVPEGRRRAPRGGAPRSPGWLLEPDVGTTTSPDPEPDPVEVARAICLRLLTEAPRTRAQLAAALAKRDVPEQAAEAALGRLGEVGLIDDAAFAEAWVRSRHQGRGLARRALAHELRQRGVADDLVREAVSALTPEQELRAARALARRRLAGTRRLPVPTRVRRVAGMLARRGYAPGVAMAAVRAELAEEDTAAEFGEEWADPS